MDGIPTDFWAKLDSDSEGRVRRWHSLAAHSAEVAAVLEALLGRTLLRRRLARTAGLDDLTPVQRARLLALAALHDVGKNNHDFQDQFHSRRTGLTGHVKPIINTLYQDSPKIAEEVLSALEIEALVGWFASEESCIDFLLATWAHHGRPVRAEMLDARVWTGNARRDPIAGARALFGRVRGWFSEAFEGEAPPLPDASAFVHFYNGLLTVADWIGSDSKLFPFATDLEDPMPAARQRAAEATERLFLDAGPARRALAGRPDGFEGILGAHAPYPIQQACVDLPLHEEGSLTILESDTGSGKTEAAVARFLRLLKAGLVDGMYLALPTRSAAMQLHRRLVEMVGRVFPAEARPPVTQAVSGYIRADDAEATRLPGFEVLWDDDRGADRGWAAEHPKRYLIGPIVVGTVDQALLSGLQVRHAHMRAAALRRHFLVVDEVHASDVYMRAVLGRVLDGHLAAGGHALLMSATLGSSVRRSLAEAGPGEGPELPKAIQEAYPLLTHVGAARRNATTTHAASGGAGKAVRPEAQPIAGQPEAIAAAAVEFARQGARVLVIRNRVADCLETQRALERAAEPGLLFGVQGTPAPHHARFAAADRRLLDSAIEAAFGKRALGRGIAAATTQTVEQSLDIDADILITDLCPVDVLLQRIGRLHRHRRDRPEGFGQARCLVVVPAERDLSRGITSDGHGFKGKYGLGTVYADLRALEATWLLLEDPDLREWEIPRHNRLLVERATHPEALRGIVEAGDPRWNKHELQRIGEEIAHRIQAELVALDTARPFGDTAFPGKERRVLTRLGQDDLRVYFPCGAFNRKFAAF